MSRLLTHFTASASRVVKDYRAEKPWLEAWRRSAVWVRTPEEAETWTRVTQALAETGDRANDRELVDLRLPTLDRPLGVEGVGATNDDPEISNIWGAIHGHVYSCPKDVFDDWRPLALVSERVVVVDKYAVSLEKPREGDEAYAQSGLVAFAEFLDQVARDERRVGPAAFALRFVTSKKILETPPVKRKNQRAAESDAEIRLRAWMGACAPSVNLEARVLDENDPGTGPMHDRYIIFISPTTCWRFALGRGISAFANEDTPLSVSLVANVPEKWLRY